MTELLLLILLLCTTPLYAETNYLYASDINDNTRQSIYNAKRENYYTIQRNKGYPNDIMSDAQLENQVYFYPERKNYNTGDRHDLSHQSQPNFVPSRRTETGHNNYRDFNLNQVLAYRRVDEISGHVPYNSSYRIPPDYQYPVKDYFDRLGNRVFKQSKGIDRIAIPSRTDEQYMQMYPNLLYISDLIPSRQSINQKNKTMRYDFQNLPRYPTIREPVRNISASINNVPEMLPGNIPGIMTQRNMIPGYGYFRPNYNYGDVNNIPGTLYNSISRGK